MATRKQAENLQYLVNSLINWTDDAVVYGVAEDWRIPEQRGEWGYLIDDCDGYMSKAMELAQKYPKIVDDEDVLFAAMKLAKEIGIKNEDIAMFFVYCEPQQGIDGTPPRGGHAVLLLKNDKDDDAYVIDNRSITYNFNNRAISEKQLSELVKLPLPKLLELGFANTFVRTAKEAYEFGYLFISGKVLGDDTWDVFNNPKWENFIYPLIKKSQIIAEDEGIL